MSYYYKTYTLIQLNKLLNIANVQYMKIDSLTFNSDYDKQLLKESWSFMIHKLTYLITPKNKI